MGMPWRLCMFCLCVLLTVYFVVSKHCCLFVLAFLWAAFLFSRFMALVSNFSLLVFLTFWHALTCSGGRTCAHSILPRQTGRWRCAFLGPALHVLITPYVSVVLFLSPSSHLCTHGILCLWPVWLSTGIQFQTSLPPSLRDLTAAGA